MQHQPQMMQAPQFHLGPDPKWGCLKNGTKPTFRAVNNENRIQLNITEMPDDPMMNETTSMMGEDNTDNANINVVRAELSESAEATNKSIEATYGARKQRLDEYKREHFKNELKNQQPVIKIRETKQHIVTKKYKLGKYTNKNGQVIGVLIKNRQTQHNIEKKRNEMRHIPLHTIKARLHKKNLLKVGSIAPPDILRELYENAVFAGDIENDGDGILLHNFLSSTENDNT